ncbi:unnamed protein product [Pedinophyceae sp. YPF-701]|nr:unnamed protein product [Pedinophyceae sp. YPF-701]
MSDDIVGEAESLVVRSRNCSEKIDHFERKYGTELASLAAQAKQLNEEITNLTRKLDKQGRKGDYDAVSLAARRQADVAMNIYTGAGPGGDLRRYAHGGGTKRPKWFLLTTMLGAKTNVMSVSKEESLAIKEEYHSFRDRSASIMTLFAALLLYLWHRATTSDPSETGLPSFTPVVMTLTQIFEVWLAFFYTAIAARENVLVVNGSHIRPWWILHHYISLFAVIVIITLPIDSTATVSFTGPFLLLMLIQGLVMMMQNRYQRKRMYARVAVGKSGAMDVVSGESSGAAGQLLLLYPLLFAFQGFEAFVGALVVRGNYHALLNINGYLEITADSADLRGCRSLTIVGVIVVILALGNFHSTVRTILGKRTFARKAKSQSYANLQKLSADQFAAGTAGRKKK